MKKLSLFFLAALLSMSVFAAGETGKTKGQAIQYDWNTGIHVSSEAGVGKWYVVMLRKADGGPFNANGKTDDGKININVSVVNPLNVEADINCTAYIGDNETNRHFKLAAGGIKSMTFGAGAFIKMGIDRVYLYLVMDVTVSEEEAQAHEAVNVNVTPVENENSVVFVPDTFRWNNGWPNKNLGITIPANKETWVMFDFATTHSLQNNHTYKFYIEKNDATPITVDAGVSYDCPASSIQEQSQELKSASTAKVLDEAKLSMIPDTMYVRIKAAQELRIYAEQVAIPEPDPEAQPIFNILNGNAGSPAIEVLLWDENDPTANVYTLDADHLVYSVDYATLQAEENYYRQIEVTNNGSSEVTIVGKASKTPKTNGDVYSVATKTVVIPAGQTYTKKIDKTMQNVVGSEAGDKIYALGPEFPEVTFKLTQQPVDPEFCHDATAFVWDTWNYSSDWASWDAQKGGFQWYSVNIHDAREAKADIILTMETVNPSEEADITVDLAAACALGEPTQNYSGKSKSTTKTLSYSLYKDNANDEMFVRVRTDKAIKVKAELLTAVIYNPGVYGTDHAGWSADPVVDKAARVEKDLTIDGTIKALGITLADENVDITIENGGKLIVGKEGIKGSESSAQILVKEGGILLIDPAATSNNKPFITAEKMLHFGAASADARRADKHEFIALPIDNREELVGVYYYGWNHATGWVANGFNKTFTGYDVYQISSNEHYSDFNATFKGQLAANKNQTLSMPGAGWHAFGNSWLDAIDVDKILANVGAAEAAVHVYVATPEVIGGTSYGLENDEKLYIPLTSAIASATGMTKVASMQGFFLYTESATSATLKYADLDAFSTAAPAPAKRVANNNTMAAAVVRGGNQSDFVYLIEGEDANAHKMMSEGLAIYAEDGLAQVANSNLIGTTLTLQTNDATEYTLSFTWLKGETLYLKDLANGNIIAMTADSKYTFNAEPNTVSERFQVIGRNDAPTAIENTTIEGANKFIENGRVVIIKNGVKYDVLGTQL